MFSLSEKREGNAHALEIAVIVLSHITCLVHSFGVILSLSCGFMEDR